MIGAAVGYPAHLIAPFIESLRRAGYRGDVALVVDRRLARVGKRDPLFRDVAFITAMQWVPMLFGLLGQGRRRRLFPLWRAVSIVAWTVLATMRGLLRPPLWLVGALLPPTESRFLVFERYLAGADYDRVLISDVRDVLFQRDPFETLPARGLAVSIESRQLTLTSEAHNAAWLRLAYGAEVLERIGERPVSCSGVTTGDRDAVRRYLRLMCREILRLPWRALGRSGVDQAVHNYLLWTGQLGDVHALETLAGPVATLGAMPDGQFRFDVRGRLIDDDGHVIAVVHQYDRIPGMKEKLLNAADG